MEQKFYRRYVARFVVVSSALLVVMAFLPTPGILNLLVTMGTAFYAGRLFAKDHNRQPHPSEQNRFAAAGFVVLVGFVLLVTAIMLAVMPPEGQDAFFQPFREPSWSVIIVGSLIAILMMWGSIHFGFGLGAKIFLKKIKA